MISWFYDTAIAVTALLALVLIIRKPVARHFGASVAYCLWLLPAARLLMPSLSVEVPIAPSAIASASEAAAAQSPQAAEAAFAVDQAARAASFDWLPVIIALWLGGAALLFIVQMIRYCAMRDELLADAEEIDRIGTIRIIESDRIEGPLAFGLFRRFVAVPRNFSRLFDPRERELALAHEMAHHKAGDLFANLAAFIVLCLFWFNPLAWLAWSAFRFDQEAACDARVLAGADVATRQSYGRALARSVTADVPSFAMALNSPRTVIERLRRLMMQDPSKSRRIAGRLAILTATAIALPMTATVVPVFAEEAPRANEEGAAQKETLTRKVIIIKNGDGKPVTVDVKGDVDTPFVKTIKKDGKTIILRTTKELSDADVEKLVAEAEKSRAEAEAELSEAEAKRAESEAVAGEAEGQRAEADAARDETEARKEETEAPRAHRVARITTWSSAHNSDMSNMVPNIHVSELRGHCTDGQHVTANGFDSKKKATIAISVCGKGHAKLTRTHLLSGLKEARAEMKNEGDIPEPIRKSVLDSLQQQIDRMEQQLADEKDDS
jgi:bla regulator protein blaR1